MDADGSGVVTKEDLRQKAKEVNYYLSEDELESTIQSMDEDGDGKITLEEFIASMVSTVVLSMPRGQHCCCSSFLKSSSDLHLR